METEQMMMNDDSKLNLSFELKKDNVFKIYNDGSHYVGTLVQPTQPQKHHVIVRTDNTRFNKAYIMGKQKGLNKGEMIDYLMDEFKDKFSDQECLYNYVIANMSRCKKNIAMRRNRFRRKANLNNFNYFVTFTYDDKKMDETEFKRKLKRCLSNLHNRKNWNYMGVFERAPQTNRLHFHGLIYVPKGELVGEIREERNYNKNERRMVTTEINSFFEKRFGRNDFQYIDEAILRCTNTIYYIVKYINKSDERIVYSRNLPSEIYRTLKEDDIICEFINCMYKVVLFSDVIVDERYNHYKFSHMNS